jgi:hypothetical protein
MRRLLILGVLGCVIAAVLVPTALQANEASGGGKKPKLPRACSDAFSSAEDAFATFDEIFGQPGDAEDLGILGELVGALSGGETADLELEEISDAINSGQESELAFFDSLDTCLSKVRT